MATQPERRLIVALSGSAFYHLPRAPAVLIGDTPNYGVTAPEVCVVTRPGSGQFCHHRCDQHDVTVFWPES